MTHWQEIWAQLTRGEHAVVHGQGAFPPPDARSLRLIVLDCEAFPAPRGVLEEACRLLRPLQSAAPQSAMDAAAERVRSGLRQHLLDEAQPEPDIARYQRALRVHTLPGDARVALFLRSVDRADPVSLAILKHLFDSERVLRVPLLLGFDLREPDGPARQLLDQLRRALPQTAFWWQDARGPSSPPAPSTGSTPTAVQSWRQLAPLTLRVLRAAATVGNRFESEVIASLLGLDELEVLAALQEAVDHGLEVEDRGQGVFRTPPALGDALRQTTLPSLARAWHEQLARVFGGPPVPLRSEPSLTPGTHEQALPTPLPLLSEGGAPAPGAPGAEADVLEAGLASTSDWRDPRRGPWWQRLELGLAAPPAPAPEAAQRPPAFPADESPPSVRIAAAGPSDPRAARHAEAAGLWTEASARHLAAAEQATRNGSHQLALEYATRALSLSANLPDGEQRRQLRARALLIDGRSRWQSPTAGESASLSAALVPLLECRALLTDTDPPELRAELACAIANVQYDLGTPGALEIALNELTLASQLFLDSGRALDAACLLNDEAAVWVKLGDPVRAHHLLLRSREVFVKGIASHPEARRELAETEHLLARLLLQAPARPGREDAALQLGIEHGRAAEEAYRSLGYMRNLGRVWETLARLELRLGQLGAALALLEQARQLQLQLGDEIGRARSCAAAADVCAANRDYARALQHLAESVALNSSKGLRAGLQFNLSSLQKLEAQLPSSLQGTSRSLQQRLLQALGN